AAPAAGPPPLVAANGDRVVATLLRLLQESGAVVGLVQADRDAAFRLLAAGKVLAAGSHAGGFPTHAGTERVARIHLVSREIGLAFRPLAREAYGLLVCARDLGDGNVVRICEVAQGERFRAQAGAVAGYDPAGAGDIRYDGA